MKKTIRNIIIGGILLLIIITGISYYYFLKWPNITVPDDGILLILPEDSFDSVMKKMENKGALPTTKRDEQQRPD